VGPDTPMLEQVKKLALQLHDGEAGLVRSPQGWHIVKRVPPPPPDPLESVDVLARPNVAQKVTIKQILLNWNGNLNWKDSTRRYVDNPRAHARDRATLEKLVKDTVAKIKAGAKIEDLMKALSEDSSTAGTGETYELEPSDRWFPPGCKAIALRLNVHEVGVAKSNWGIHIMLRTE
jgi:parvulin-like peptidyl-prolyl isomerase